VDIRRCAVIWAAAAIVALVSEGSQVVEAPSVDEREKYYEVAGVTERELHAAVRRASPFGRYDAYTEWGISYAPQFSSNADGTCSVVAVRVKVEATITLPRWTNQKEASDDVQGRWHFYLRGLRKHEHEHVQNGIAGAEAVRKAVLALPPAPSCEVLNERSERSAKAVIDEAVRKDKSYDLRSLHSLAESPFRP
jgi:predicted secreted Zn-dependent protease